MKLYKLLFESVGRDDVLKELKNLLMLSSSETANFLEVAAANHVKSLGKKANFDEMVENFYDTNKAQFDRILSFNEGAKTFKYRGGGSLGNVFDLGNNTVLKIELKPKGHLAWASSGERAEKAASALFSKGETARKAKAIAAGAPASYAPTVKKKTVKEAIDNDDIASVVPMIYDQGSFEYPPGSGEKFDWVVMEKFETLDAYEQREMNHLLNVITDRFARGDTQDEVEDINTYSKSEKDIIEEIGKNKMLKDNWFKKLVDGMVKLHKVKIADFHAGNIGIRRIGPEGEFIFFD